MYIRETVAEKRNSKKGEIGEAFIQWYVVYNNMGYKKGTEQENREKGIDCYVENIPTDIKNTDFIFLANIAKSDGKLFTRHPFREGTKSENYIILKNTETSFNILYNGPIDEYLLEHYIKDKQSLIEFKKELLNCNSKSYKELGFPSIDIFALRLKQKLCSFIKNDVFIHYSDINSKEVNVSLKMFTKDKTKNIDLNETN